MTADPVYQPTGVWWRRLIWWFRSDAAVSRDWLQHHARSERVEFHSPPMQWPVKKVLNDHPLWNRAQWEKERKRA